MDFKLSQPIDDISGNKISKFELREPTTKDYLKLGEIQVAEVRTDGDIETVIVSDNRKTLSKYLQICTGQPEGVLFRISLSDMKALEAVVKSFLAGEETPAET